MGLLSKLIDELNEGRPESEKLHLLNTEKTTIDNRGRQHSRNGRYAQTIDYKRAKACECHGMEVLCEKCGGKGYYY